MRSPVTVTVFPRRPIAAAGLLSLIALTALLAAPSSSYGDADTNAGRGDGQRACHKRAAPERKAPAVAGSDAVEANSCSIRGAL
jgi:hypothetical protein